MGVRIPGPSEIDALARVCYDAPGTGASESLTAGNNFSNAFGASSADGSTFYFTRTISGQGLLIRALTYPVGLERTVAYADNPPAQY
jgi:hypothetical protein